MIAVTKSSMPSPVTADTSTALGREAMSASRVPASSRSALLRASTIGARGGRSSPAAAWKDSGSGGRGIDDVHQDIGVADGREGGVSHGAVQGVTRLEQPRGVEDDHLGVLGGANADDAMPGGLRLGRSDGKLLADEAIEQRRLTGVGEAGDGNDACPGHTGHEWGMMDGGRYGHDEAPATE